MLTGLRSGDVIEVLLDINRNFLSEDEVLESMALNNDQKANEIDKLRNLSEIEKNRYHIKFNSIFTGHSSLQLSHK